MGLLRILIVQETNWIDRNVVHQHHIAERLAGSGHDVRVIDYDILWPERARGARWQPRQVFPAVSRVVEGVTLPVTRPATMNLSLLCHVSWAVSSLLELRALLAGWRPDVVIGLSLTNSYPMALLLKRARVPYVSMILEPYHTMVPQRWAWPMARLAERRAARAADRVVVFTPHMRRYALDMGVRADRISLLKTGVSLDLFHPHGNGRAQRAALGILPGETVLFFMGWLYDFSGLREIARALCQDPALLNGARLLVVGDGDLYDELGGLVQQHNLAQRIILTGRRPYAQVPDLLAAADVCLLPSLENDTTREIVPMKVYEYLAAGKPVVAVGLPGIVAEFAHQAGIVYADDPVDALKKALALAAQPGERARLGVTSRRYAEANANWARTTADIEALLLALQSGAVGDGS
jgi:glycosyltransferase involved in cell wall biosynthesis